MFLCLHLETGPLQLLRKQHAYSLKRIIFFVLYGSRTDIRGCQIDNTWPKPFSKRPRLCIFDFPTDSMRNLGLICIACRTSWHFKFTKLMLLWNMQSSIWNPLIYIGTRSDRYNGYICCYCICSQKSRKMSLTYKQ